MGYKEAEFVDQNMPFMETISATAASEQFFAREEDVRCSGIRRMIAMPETDGDTAVLKKLACSVVKSVASDHNERNYQKFANELRNSNLSTQYHAGSSRFLEFLASEELGNLSQDLQAVICFHADGYTSEQIGMYLGLPSSAVRLKIDSAIQLFKNNRLDRSD